MQNLILCDLKKCARFEFRGESYDYFKFGLRIRVSGEVLEVWGFGFVDRVGFRDMIYFVDRVGCRDMIYFVDRVSFRDRICFVDMVGFVGWKRMDTIKMNQKNLIQQPNSTRTRTQKCGL